MKQYMCKRNASVGLTHEEILYFLSFSEKSVDLEY